MDGAGIGETQRMPLMGRATMLLLVIRVTICRKAPRRLRTFLLSC